MLKKIQFDSIKIIIRWKTEDRSQRSEIKQFLRRNYLISDFRPMTADFIKEEKT